MKSWFSTKQDNFLYHNHFYFNNKLCSYENEVGLIRILLDCTGSYIMDVSEGFQLTHKTFKQLKKDYKKADKLMRKWEKLK